ncbi:MAG: hypothetical protein IRZ09_15250 [Variibacter sp.]|nr:hypothetical protein [Variibacter sp.]
MTYIVTAAGRRLSLLDPDPALVDFGDIAVRLHEIRRYAGMTLNAGGWTVAQHTLLVAALVPPEVPEAVPYALLHDAHEGYIGDWITPVKQALAADGQGARGFSAAGALYRLEQRMARAIHARAGLPFPPHDDIATAVKYADQQAYTTEVRHLVPARQAREFTIDGLPPPADAALIEAVMRLDARAALASAFARHFGRAAS